MKTQNFKTNMKRQEGATMVEYILWISFAVLATLGALLLYPMGRDGYERKQLTEQINTIATNLLVDCNNSDCSDVSTANVLASGVIKEYHNNDDTSVMSVSGVAIEFAPANIGPGTNNGISQTHENINQRVCNNLVKGLWDTVALINIGGVAVKANPNDAVDTSSVNTNCVDGANQIEIITSA